MISQSELRKKALRPWTTGNFLKSQIEGEPFPPLEIPFKTPTGKVLVSEYSKVREWIAQLREQSRSVKGFGYGLEFRTIQHKHLGQQTLPDRIYFDNCDDWLKFIGQSSAFKQFNTLLGSTQRELPQVMPLLRQKPHKVLEYGDVWPKLMSVCRYFQLNPQPRRYIRQLDIKGVDTKFIESHKGVLSELLSLALEPDEFDSAITGMAESGFERRFGLLYDEPLVRFRLLDSTDPVTDKSVPLSQFIDPGVSRIYITENKINGLAFPPQSDAIVIFGMGYGVRSLFAVDWLKQKRLIYWGDIDTHGFSILSVLRSRFSQTESLLMDEATLEQHRSLSVQEPKTKRFLGDLTGLTEQENRLFDDLRQNRLGENLRLEQERIGYSWLIQELNEIAIQKEEQ